MLNSHRPAGTGVILVTLLLASLLEVVYLPESVALFRPHWVLMVLLYWVMALPHRVGVLWGFFVGLYLDVLLGTTLGQWALACAFSAFITLPAYKRVRVYPAFQQSMVMFLLIGSASLLAYLVQESVGRTLYPPYTILYSAGMSALLWRVLFTLLRWVQSRFLVR